MFVKGSVVVASTAPNKMQQRRCEFFASSGKTDQALQSGNVNGTTQYCAKTQCCMGYFKVVDGDFSPDWLGEGHFYFYSNIHEYVFMKKTGTMMLYR